MGLLGAMVVGGMVGRHAARRQFQAMSNQQNQEAEIQKAQAQASHPQTAPKETDTFQKLEKLTNMKQQGLITDEEFQKMKAKLLSDF